MQRLVAVTTYRIRPRARTRERRVALVLGRRHQIASHRAPVVANIAGCSEEVVRAVGDRGGAGARRVALGVARNSAAPVTGKQWRKRVSGRLPLSESLPLFIHQFSIRIWRPVLLSSSAHHVRFRNCPHPSSFRPSNPYLATAAVIIRKELEWDPGEEVPRYFRGA